MNNNYSGYELASPLSLEDETGLYDNTNLDFQQGVPMPSALFQTEMTVDYPNSHTCDTRIKEENRVGSNTNK